MPKLITINVPTLDGIPQKVTGYRFQARVGNYCHWFLVDALEARISHYDSGLFVGDLVGLGAHLGDRVAAAKASVADLVKSHGAAEVHRLLCAAPPRPRNWKMR